MPIYEYRCNTCGERFTRFSRVMSSSSEEAAPPCPVCQGVDTQRLVSSFSAQGPGGPDAAEVAHQHAQDARSAAITPQEQIASWRKAK